MARGSSRVPEDSPLWYKSGIIYEVHVRAFYDSNGDGVGDFRGLTDKLDYLQDLGVTALWLLPFYPSPLKDDGYDIADYQNVNPTYGNLRDFQVLLREAHVRGIRIITELVLNHVSDQHPWFQRARRARPGSRYRDFFVWSDSEDKYKDTRIIFKDFETSNWAWDPVAKAYYWHRFYSHQPDLNFDHPPLKRALFQSVDYWLRMGVDGLRLDAVPYLFEREGTSCENLPETHAFLRELREHVDRKFPNRVLLAEANQWPTEAAAYFGQGDECHMAFHFPLMPRLFMSIRMEDRFPIVDIMQQTPDIAESAQWAIFLRNHDELTLEMVTDEERDYMYRVYAVDPQARINLGIRHRLAPLLGNNRRRIELMNALLFSMPGTVVIYYGDEIGMGDNIYLGDRNGVRTPMQWSADRNAGFSRSNPQRLFLPVIIDPEYHFEAVNVETQQGNPSSLLWFMKRLIDLRKRYQAFGYGTMEFLPAENRKVLTFLRRYGNETLLVVANLSRYVQAVEVDLSEFKEMVPVELFGQTPFPPIGELPYFLTMSPHSFYWFSLVAQRAEVDVTSQGNDGPPPIIVQRSWETVLTERGKEALEARLPEFLRARRWFGGKARRIQSTRITDAVPVTAGTHRAHLALVEVQYRDDNPETYVLPLTFMEEHNGQPPVDSRALVSRLTIRNRGKETHGVLYDAMWDKQFTIGLFNAISRRRRYRTETGELVSHTTRAFKPSQRTLPEGVEPAVFRGEQSNTSVVFGDRFVMKLIRKLDVGPNPDIEIGRYLTEKTGFPNIAALVGAFDYRRRGVDPAAIAILQEFVPNQGDAWQYTLDYLSNYYERVLAFNADAPQVDPPTASLTELAAQEIPESVNELLGGYAQTAWILGTRTAELHVALTSDPDDPAFAPEPFNDFYRQSLFQSMSGHVDQTLNVLRSSARGLDQGDRELVQHVLAHESKLREQFRFVRLQRVGGMRTRCHGDYHLGQLLHTGRDFIIIDFEGEPARSVSERRIKRSPLRDVAGMLRSFEYASHAARLGQAAEIRPADVEELERWGQLWSSWVSVIFLNAYLKVPGVSALLPGPDHLDKMLGLHLVEKALYEVSYELNNRPNWVRIPLTSILRYLDIPK